MLAQLIQYNMQVACLVVVPIRAWEPDRARQPDMERRAIRLLRQAAARPQAATASQVQSQQQQQPVLLQQGPVQPLREGQVASSGDVHAGQPMIPPQLQSAVQQLSQQRASVVQAVQERASRALHGRFQEPEQTTSPSTPRTSSAVIGQQGEVMEQSGRQGWWSVTRISEVLHRRVVAPVMEHVTGPQTSSTSSVLAFPNGSYNPGSDTVDVS